MMISNILVQVQGNNLMSFLPFLLIIVVFYFFMIRPQQKKLKDHKKLISEVKPGDKIITTAGIHGKIISIADTTFLLEVEGGSKIRFDKSAISLEATKTLNATNNETSIVKESR